MSLGSSGVAWMERMDLARRRFDALHRQLAAGELDRAAFEAARAELLVVDEAGHYWTPEPEGRWLCYDGATWVPRPAPVAPQPQPQPGAVAASGRPAAAPRRAPLGRVVALAAIFLLVLLGSILALGLSVPDLEPRLVQLDRLPQATAPGYPVSAAQSSLLQQYGYPDAFIILFYDEAEQAAQGATRQELWAWHQQALSVTFIDGEPVSTQVLPEGGPVYATPYRPEQFTAAMGLEEVLAAAQVAEYLVAPLEEELVPGAETYFADQLAFGLKDGRLLYVEGIAFDDTES